MTAAPRRAALEVVPDPVEATTQAAATPDSDNATWSPEQTVIDQFSAEHQLVGSLMWLSTDTARALLDLVPDHAIWRPQARWACELIRRVVDTGTAPTPTAVLAAGRRHARSDALQPDQPPTAKQHGELALYLYDAYSQAVAPAVAATSYAREVLDEAYRRAFDTCGLKMQELSTSATSREELTSQFGLIRGELADLWRRCEAAQGFDTQLQTQPTPLQANLLRKYRLPVQSDDTATHDEGAP